MWSCNMADTIRNAVDFVVEYAELLLLSTKHNMYE